MGLFKSHQELDKTTLTIQLDKKLKQKLKDVSHNKSLTVSGLIKFILSDYCEKFENGNQN